MSKGQIAWNRGVKMWEGKKHPKGMLNKKHSKLTKKKISDSLAGGNSASFKKGHKLSEETKKKISYVTKGQKNPFYGKSHSKASKKKMSLSSLGKPSKKKGKPLSKETKQKISDARKKLKLFGEKNSFFGKHHSESTKKILRYHRAKRIFPKKDSSIEVKIQNFLKQLNIDFFTHQYIKEIEHSYQCDILIPSMNLVIECDGNYWHKYPIGNDIDHIRTKELLEKGFKVLRLWEFEIKQMDLNQLKCRLDLRD